MDDLNADFETYKRMHRKKDSAKRSKLICFLQGVGICAVITLLFLLVVVGFDYRNGVREKEKALTADEWVTYETLKSVIKGPLDTMSRIYAYERLLSTYRAGRMPSYTPQDSLGWENSCLELKRRFNTAIRAKSSDDNKMVMEYYNERVYKYPRLTDPNELPHDFSPLPKNLSPYKLSISDEERQEPPIKHPH